ncbi:MAG: hypothetical protein AAGD25_18990 [Cyanobacteria bacterium P01_F01_bin.150]
MDTNYLLERILTAFERNNDLLEQVLGERSSKPKAMPLSDAWKELGYNNYQQCYRKVKRGHYRLGYEVEDRRSPNAPDPQYWLDIEACRTRDKVLPAKRKP